MNGPLKIYRRKMDIEDAKSFSSPREAQAWDIMWYEQGSADESFKKGFASREAAEAWARTQPSVRHRYSHAVVYTKGVSYGLRRKKA